MSVYDQLVGQAHLVKILEGAVAAARSGEESQEMTHAWLFTGPPGSGRSSAAVAFASALICSNDGCGTCVNCRAAKAGTHADVEIIRTEGLSIKVEEVRELSFGRPLSPSAGDAIVAGISPENELIALLKNESDKAKPVAVFAAAH